jgi:hypothetical protein
MLAAVFCALFFGGEVRAQSSKTYQVTIETVPPDATVYLDDKSKGPIGVTPFKPKIKQGTHTLYLELDGYDAQSLTLIIDKTSYKKTFSYTLIKSIKNPTIDVRAKAGDLSANGAEVYVDGASWGPLPISKQVNIGRHLVEVKKPDFNLYAEWVDVREGETRTVSVSLSPLAKDSTLRVEGTSGAQVYVDGVLKGNVPAVIEKVSPGRHFVEVKKEGFEKFEQWTEFKGGDSVTVNANLVAQAPKVVLATIKVFAPDLDPAKVYLDGDLKGESPLLITDVNPGDHFLEVRKEGYKTYERQLSLTSGQNAVERVSMISAGPKLGTIRVISPQVEAMVYIDGNLLGPVPAERSDLSKGDHFIVVKKPGFKDWEKKITVDEKTPAMELVAELVATGNVKLFTNLAGGDIFLDGELRPEKSPAEGSPLELRDLRVGEHTIMVRLADYKEFVETISVTAGETKNLQVTLIKVGPTAEELLLRRKTISTYGAKVIHPGNLAIDIMGGLPYYAEVHFTTGLQLTPNPEENFIPLDLGVDLKIAGSINEIYVRGKYQFFDSPVFGLAAEASLGGGLGLARVEEKNEAGDVVDTQTNFSANSVGLTAYGIASLFFRDVLTVSARLGVHAYSDGSQGAGFVEAQDEKGDAGRDAGARLMVGLAAQIHSRTNSKLSYNFVLNGNPGQVGDATGRTMFDLAFPFSDPLLYAQAGVTLKF